MFDFLEEKKKKEEKLIHSFAKSEVRRLNYNLVVFTVNIKLELAAG